MKHGCSTTVLPTSHFVLWRRSQPASGNDERDLPLPGRRCLDEQRLLLTTHRNMVASLLLTGYRGGGRLMDVDVPYGTLDLMVLKILDSLGPLHGYGVA